MLLGVEHRPWLTKMQGPKGLETYLPWLLLGILFFLAILAILWLILPFGVFGTKSRIDTLRHEQHRTNELLRETNALLGRLVSEAEESLNPDRPPEQGGSTRRDRPGR